MLDRRRTIDEIEAFIRFFTLINRLRIVEVEQMKIFKKIMLDHCRTIDEFEALT